MNLFALVVSERIRVAAVGTFIICLCCLVGCQPATPSALPLDQSVLDRQDFQQAYTREKLTESDQAGKLCESSNALECYEAAYFSTDYLDLLMIQLERYPDDETARKYQSTLIALHTANGDIETPLTPYLSGEDHRWLGSTRFADGELFLGGAIKGNIAVRIQWLRNTGTVTARDAIEVFSRLIDAQMAKLEQ